MLPDTTEIIDTHAAIERYITAAIVGARGVCEDRKWLAWAEHWLAGRDRSFASARGAHRLARDAGDVRAAGTGRDDLEPTEEPWELAAWAAHLAMVTAPVAPDPGARIRRIEFAIRTRLSGVRKRRPLESRRPAVTEHVHALARRAASMLSSSRLPKPPDFSRA